MNQWLIARENKKIPRKIRLINQWKEKLPS